MFYKLTTKNAQDLCGLVSTYFDHLANACPEFGEEIEIKNGDFISMARCYTPDPAEEEGAVEIDKRVTALARAIFKMTE